jgi:hypothetical protein
LFFGGDGVVGRYTLWGGVGVRRYTSLDLEVDGARSRIVTLVWVAFSRGGGAIHAKRDVEVWDVRRYTCGGVRHLLG